MKIRVELEDDAESGGWSAVCPELPGCASCGETREEALAHVKEAIQLYLEPTFPPSPGAETVFLCL